MASKLRGAAELLAAAEALPAFADDPFALPVRNLARALVGGAADGVEYEAWAAGGGRALALLVRDVPRAGRRLHLWAADAEAARGAAREMMRASAAREPPRVFGAVRLSTVDALGLPLRHNGCEMYALPDGARVVPAAVPGGYAVAPLREEDAAAVSRSWIYAGEKSELYVARLVRTGRTRAAYDASTGAPVAWVLLDLYGALALLHVAPEHRRRGLGAAVASALAADLVAAGEPAYCFITEGNAASVALFSGRLGFRPRGGATWSHVLEDHVH